MSYSKIKPSFALQRVADFICEIDEQLNSWIGIPDKDLSEINLNIDKLNQYVHDHFPNYNSDESVLIKQKFYPCKHLQSFGCIDHTIFAAVNCRLFLSYAKYHHNVSIVRMQSLRQH